MPKYEMLGEFVHYCSKCKIELNHRIILMDGEKPGRVLCLTCNTERKYKEPSQSTLKRARKKATGKPTKAEQARQENEWRILLGETDVTPKKYNINESFDMNDHVAHPKFGKGLVVGFNHPDKVRIFFDDGLKILKGQKAA